jgi:hypothetical protein
MVTGGRDLRRCLDKFGHISVDVEIGGGPGAGRHSTGASAKPATVARFLRELADDVERLSQDAGDAT